MIKLDKLVSDNNYKSLLWHTVFLAITSSFIDIDTVIPSMLVKAGGGPFLLGLSTSILLGAPYFFQLVFAGYLSGKERKKPYLIMGITLRFAALLAMGLMLIVANNIQPWMVIAMIFILISIFSVSGAFATISYVDIMGRSMFREKRKSFFTMKQVLSGAGLFISALIVKYILKRMEYPDNYALLFVLAGVLLAIASLGFWRIQEVIGKDIERISFVNLFRRIPQEIKTSKNLRYYVLVINSLGLVLSILPFLIIYAKSNLGLSYGMIGNFLLFRIIGMILAGFFWYKISDRIIYKHVLKTSIYLGALLPILAIVFNDLALLYQLIFLLSGFFVASYKTAIDGILIEISNSRNRTMYAGISGAGNIMIILFPLIVGGLAQVTGYEVLFFIVSVITLSSIFFANKLDCRMKPVGDTTKS